METQPNIYPPKPNLIENKNKIRNLVTSIVLFFVVGHYLLGQDWLFVLGLILVLAVHESGHFLMMKVFGYKNISMLFIPALGAVVNSSKPSKSLRAHVIMVMGGPIPGIIIGFILLLLVQHFGMNDLLSLASIFLFLNVFNLIPVYPLDGGQLARSLFFNAKTSIQLVFTVISIVILIAFSIYYEAYPLLVIPFFMFLSLVGAKQTDRFRKKLSVDGIDCDRHYDELSDYEYWTIRKVASASFKDLNKLNPDAYGNSPQDKRAHNLIKGVMVPKTVDDISIAERLLYTTIWITFFLGPILYYVFELRY